MSVTLEFIGVSSVGGGRRRLELPVNDSTTVRNLLGMAGEQTGEADLPGRLEGICMVLIEGQNILYLQGWDTPVQPGQRVAVVPMVGGG
jgi:molybdopterin converting factor small subunit